MRETINPTKGQSSTPKMRTTQLYQFISIYLIIFKSLTCTNSQTIDQKTLQKFHAFSQQFISNHQFTKRNEFSLKILDECETIETKRRI